MQKELIVENNPKSIISEAIKTIKTNIQFTMPDREIKTILITSSLPGEGKSFVSSNLAVAYAKAGKKVLLVDTDMRRGRLHKVFKANGEKGLSNLLIDSETRYDSYIQKTMIENVSVITRGIIPPNPSELLSSNNNKKLIKYLENKFDIIIFDGCPVGGLTDSLIMAKLVDRAVIVTALNQTPIEMLKNTKKTLENIDCIIGGIIVNKVARRSKYQNYYYEA